MSPISSRKAISKFSCLALIIKHFLKIQPNMLEQEKKRPRIYDLLNDETKPKFLCQPYRKQRKNFYRKTFKKKVKWRIEQKKKKKKKKCKSSFLTALDTTKKDLTMSIRKHGKELKVLKKTVKTAIKQDLSQDLNSLDYAMRHFRKQNKCNFPSKYCFA